MTIVNPEPANTTKVEPKVQWATIGAYAAGVVGLGLVNVVSEGNNQLLIDVLPDGLEAFVLPLVPALTALLGGFVARHQWRTAPGARGGATGSTPIG